MGIKISEDEEDEIIDHLQDDLALSGDEDDVDDEDHEMSECLDCSSRLFCISPLFKNSEGREGGTLATFCTLNTQHHASLLSSWVKRMSAFFRAELL